MSAAVLDRIGAPPRALEAVEGRALIGAVISLHA